MNLNSAVGELPLVGPVYQKRLEKLGIRSIRDLLWHVPARYIEDNIVIKGKLTSLKNQYTRSGKKIQIGKVGETTLVWFNQPYLTRVLFPNETYTFSGKMDWFGQKRALISPFINEQGIIPVYPETYGVTSKWLRKKIKIAYELVKDEIKEYLPETYGFLSLPEAIRQAHFPQKAGEGATARKRLAFDELLGLQLKSIKRRAEWQKNKASYQSTINNLIIQQLINSLPFKLTASQARAVAEITADLAKPYPMNRLLEGDVGSGKTVVAAVAAYAAFANGYQTVVMAPTQILAQQHFNTLNSLLYPFKVRINLITSAFTTKEIGRTDIFVGTHSLIHQKLALDKVALVVIDEQQKFGVEQRERLVKKTRHGPVAPHILAMTATPIPRTVALTFYGDLDLSTLTEIPGNRPKITTWIVPPEKRVAAYEWIKSYVISHKSQVFIVCPLIEKSEKETMKDVKAVTAEFSNLKSQFPNLKLGLLHGRMKANQKDKVVRDFRNKEIDILVTTPVIEVGIDIPNAAIIVIEAAERFGLAQLHQLRGRIGRGETKSYCLLFAESPGEKALERLKALRQNFSGFELAELDLKLRGPGEIFGTRQHGIPDLKIASWTDIDLIKKAKEVVKLTHDPFT